MSQPWEKDNIQLCGSLRKKIKSTIKGAALGLTIATFIYVGFLVNFRKTDYNNKR